MTQLTLELSVDGPPERRIPAALPWVTLSPPDADGARAPCFVTEDGAAWCPIGQNDSIAWPELNGLFRRKDLATAERYLDTLAAHGVTVLRLMLEYAQDDSRYFERPAGRMQPQMVRLWDDLFRLCESRSLRILLTPYDTFWMWNRWARHPYNKRNGGPCGSRAGALVCPETRKAIKARLGFAAERWGGSGALFAWDLWNEIHPSYAGNSAECFSGFITDVGEHVREVETRLYGRCHPQTVSMFGPHLTLDPRIPESIFRHPRLDFASTHFYEEGSIDCPRNTVDAALSVARLVRESLAEAPPDRPFFDSESGPIHTFKDRHRSLPEAFDDEYFRHMQWAHFAAGGAGGGMRWPNRRPHSLTPGMRLAQAGLARFLPLIDWRTFHRRNLNAEVKVSNPKVRIAACGDSRQVAAWLIRNDATAPGGLMKRDAAPVQASIRIPDLEPASYSITAWNTAEGRSLGSQARAHAGGVLAIDVPPFAADIALAISASRPSGSDRG